MRMVESAYVIPGASHLALLADLHGWPYQDVIASLVRNKPEIICIAGDIMIGNQPEEDSSPLDSEQNVLPFLEECARIAPTFLSLGNHERILDAEDLNRIGNTGVTLLDNRWIQKDNLVIGGLTSAYVTDYRHRRPQNSPRRYPRVPMPLTAPKPEMDWLEEYAKTEGNQILLSHHPEYYPLVPKSINLVLSGHAHGGQIQLFHRGLFAPGQGWLPKWTKGVYDSRLVVSAGLSNTASPIPRLFNPTEVVYVLPE